MSQLFYKPESEKFFLEKKTSKNILKKISGKIFQKIFFYFILFFLLPIFSFAQTATISGTIRDVRTKEIIAGAFVQILNSSDVGAVTDIEGKYNFASKLGALKINISSLGYTTFTKQIEVKLGENVFDFELEENNILLNTTTVTTGKFDKPIGEVTVSIEVLKPDLIDATNTRRLDDVLQKIPGVNIIDGQANIRGGSGWSYGAGSRVLLLIDDLPALQADAGSPNWKDIGIENIEQIEVVKGASSALYGSSAMNGIINVRTGFAKSEPETKLATSFVGYLDPSDPSKKWWTKLPYEFTTSLLHKQKFGKLDIAGSLFYTNQDIYNKDWTEKYGRFTINARYHITDRLSVGVNTNFNRGTGSYFLYWLDGKKNAYVGTASTYNASDRLRYTIDPYLNYTDKDGNRHKILTRIYNISNNLSNEQSNFSNLLYGEYQFQRSFKNDLIFTAGLVGVRSSIQAQLYGDTSYTSQNYAVYAQADKKWGKLNASLGVRYENNKIIGPKIVHYTKDLAEVTPNGGSLSESKPVFRLGLNYQVDTKTFLRTSFGQGYRFPTIAELYINTSGGAFNAIPNPFLTSETGWTAEIGVKQGININNNFFGFFDAAVFIQEYTNMMEFLASQKVFLGFQSQNIGNTSIKGFEVSFTGQGKVNNFSHQYLIGYTYIDPVYKTFDSISRVNSSVDYNVLKYRFKHAFKLDAEFGYKKINFGIAVIYNSNMEAVDRVFEKFLPGVKDFRDAHTQGFATLDLRTAYKFSEKTKVSLILANATNTEYSYRPGLLEAPRSIQLRLDQKF